MSNLRDEILDAIKSTYLKPGMCETCGVHPGQYMDSGDREYCACCYGEPYDGAECLGLPPKDKSDPSEQIADAIVLVVERRLNSGGDTSSPQ